MKLILASFLVAFSFTSFSQVNLSSSLTACYALNGNANEPINNLTGTLSAVTPTVDRFNNATSACRFLGNTGSYIRLPNNSLIKPTHISFSAWVKPVSLNIMDIVFTKNTSSNNFSAYVLNIENNGGGYKFRAYRQNGAVGDFIDCTTIIAPNTWYHVAFSIDNTNMKIYVNGVLENTITCNITNFSYDPLKDVIIGGTNEAAANYPFNGSMDNIRFYNRTINAAEVTALYNIDPSCAGQALGLAPVVAFSVSAVNVCAGKSISMTDVSANNPTAWNWQIPGAIPSTVSVSNPTISFPTPGNYIVSLVSSNTVGASNTATQSIVVLPNPNVLAIANNTSICIGQSTNLFASGATTYSWSNLQTGVSISVSPTISSTYSLTGVDNNGCINSATVSVNVNPLPVLSIQASTPSVCNGATVSMIASGASSYTWNTSQTTATIVSSPNVSMNYSVMGTNVYGCIAATSLSIAVNPLPILSIQANTLSVCNGASVSLLALGASSYTWNTGQTTATMVSAPSNNANYSVTGTNVTGCTATTSVSIIVNPLPVLSIQASSLSICNGASISLVASGASTYTWSNGQSGAILLSNPNANFTYSVTGKDINGCVTTTNVSIAVNPLPYLTITANQNTVCRGQSLVLTASGAATYTWNNNQNGGVINLNPINSSTYGVTGYDGNGCRNTAAITIFVDPCVGIEKFENNSFFEVYPNPSNGYFTLNLGERNTGNVFIVNTISEIIYQSYFENQEKLKLDLTQQKSGVYFLKLNVGGTIYTKKVIKD